MHIFVSLFVFCFDKEERIEVTCHTMLENRKIFICPDVEGITLLLDLFEKMTETKEDVKERVDALQENSDNTLKQYAVFLPPSYMMCFEDDDSPEGFYEWSPESKILNTNCVNSLKTIIKKSENADSILESDSDFLCDCLHEVADELPAPGCCILEVYLLSAKDFISTRNLQLLSTLKRLEISHQAHFGILCPQELGTKDLLSNWQNFIDFDYILVEDLVLHLKSNPLWSGLLEVKIRNSYANIPLQRYYLHPCNESRTLFDSTALENKNKKMTFDSRIEIVAMVTSDMIPMHMVNPNRFTIQKFPSSSKKDSFNFFDFRRQQQPDENVYFLAFLRFNINCDDSNKFTKSDWTSYVNDPFTHHLSASYCQQTLNNHSTLIIEFDKTTCLTYVYFLKTPDARGFLKLLKEKLGNLDDDLLNIDGQDGVKFYKNGADVIPSWRWCEKAAWLEEENVSKVVKSISRCKSDEFYMQGVMVPGIENIKEPTVVEHDFFSTISTIFDKSGTAANSSLTPIPVIDDRLLKNMKNEEDLSEMEFSDASKLIGHGIDYCLDSLSSVRLSERLTKVQKQLVPEDTISYSSGKFTAKEETAMMNLKRNKPCSTSRKSSSGSAATKPSQAKKLAKPKKETRADKTKRRLKIIVEGTITKYGQVESTHAQFKQCCDALFDVCVALIKTLKTSKDLNDNMKQFAKTNVSHVVTSVLAKTKE